MIRKLAIGAVLACGASVMVGLPAYAQTTVDPGETLVLWRYTYQGNGVGGIMFYYSNNGGKTINQPIPQPLAGSWLQGSASWTTPDSVAPIIAAYQHGHQMSVEFPNGLVIAPDVLAAMTVQGFNPASVGGESVAPSSSTITPATSAALTSMGWGSALKAYESSSTKTSTPPSSPPSSPTTKHSTAPQPTHSTTPKTTHSTTPKTSRSTQPKVSKQPVTTTTHTQHTTAPKSLPVATKTQPVSVSPSASVTTTSVPLPPKTPYLAHHHVPRSHAVVADASHPQRQVAHHAEPWPWVVAGVVVVGVAGGWIIRRRMG